MQKEIRKEQLSGFVEQLILEERAEASGGRGKRIRLAGLAGLYIKK